MDGRPESDPCHPARPWAKRKALGQLLSSVLWTHAASGVAGSRDDPRLESGLAAAWEAGRAAWPQVALPAEPFVQHIAERLPAGADPMQVLRDLHAADLFLACACCRRDPSALELFETAVVASVWS